MTAAFRKFPEGYAAFVEELPGANTQGATLDEARENLKESVEMVLQKNRDLAETCTRFGKNSFAAGYFFAIVDFNRLHRNVDPRGCAAGSVNSVEEDELLNTVIGSEVGEDNSHERC